MSTLNSFALNLASTTIPTNYYEAMLRKEWHRALTDEISTLNKNETWPLKGLPTGKKTVWFMWVYTLKFKADG